MRTASVKVWITPALREAIEKAAEHEGRSISNWIERALEKAIADLPPRKPSRKP
jgi:predicted HicB family RNase H-like nuclease